MSSLANNTRVPGFILHEKIGSGGFGEVYRATDSSPFQETVAIKILIPHPLLEIKHIKERFTREAEAIRRLDHHSIVHYKIAGFTGDNPEVPYLAMDFIQGKKLSEIANSIPYDKKISIMMDVLDALQYAHSKGVLHRDIKPSNIMIRDADNKVIVVDFGLAYVYDGISSKDLTTHYIGSMGYIPLEVQVDPSIKNEQHDVFSCGVTLYEIFAGIRPNPQTYKPLREVDNQLAGLDAIIQLAIAPRETRFKTIKDFRDQLLAWLDLFHLRAIKSGANPHILEIRKQLLERKSIQERQEIERLSAKRNAEILWQDKCDLVATAAKDAFQTISIELADILPDFIFSENPLSTENSKLFVYERKRDNFQIVFGLGLEKGSRILGELSNSKKLPDGSLFSFIKPPWGLYTEMSSQSPNVILYTSILLIGPDNPRLLAWPIGALCDTNQKPTIELKTHIEVRNHITQGIGTILQRVNI